MPEIRAGGHVIGDHGWTVMSPAEIRAMEAEAEKPLSMSNTKAELLAAAEAAGVAVDESMTKAEILEALDGAE